MDQVGSETVEGITYSYGAVLDAESLRLATELYEVEAAEGDAITLPSAFSLRPDQSSVKDQGKGEACTGFAMCAMLDRRPTHVGRQDESERFIWEIGKTVDGNSKKNVGLSFRTAMTVARFYGSTKEGVCPYRRGGKEIWDEDITVGMLRSAKDRQVIIGKLYAFDIDVIKYILYVRRRTVAIAYRVPDNQHEADVRRSGDMKNPERGFIRAGHAVCVVGYDDKRRRLIFKNSWGNIWGDNGYGTMPYDFGSNVRSPEPYVHGFYPDIMVVHSQEEPDSSAEIYRTSEQVSPYKRVVLRKGTPSMMARVFELDEDLLILDKNCVLAHVQAMLTRLGLSKDELIVRLLNKTGAR